jgi:hypothetical protein
MKAVPSFLLTRPALVFIAGLGLAALADLGTATVEVLEITVRTSTVVFGGAVAVFGVQVLMLEGWRRFSRREGPPRSSPPRGVARWLLRPAPVPVEARRFPMPGERAVPATPAHLGPPR